MAKKPVPDNYLSIDKKALRSMISPAEFFAAIKGEELKKTVIYFLVISLLFTLLFVLSLIYLSSALSGMTMGLLTFSFTSDLIFLSVIGIWLALVIGSFFLAGCYHVIARILGATKGFSETYKSVAYSFTPSAFFGWIPLVGLLFFLWSFYLNVKGLMILQEISYEKSAITISIALFAICTIAVVGIFIVVLSMINSFSSGNLFSMI